MTNLKYLENKIFELKAFKSCLLNVEQEMECETSWKVANKFANYLRYSKRGWTTALLQKFSQIFKNFNQIQCFLPNTHAFIYQKKIKR